MWLTTVYFISQPCNSTAYAFLEESNSTGTRATFWEYGSGAKALFVDVPGAEEEAIPAFSPSGVRPKPSCMSLALRWRRRCLRMKTKAAIIARIATTPTATPIPTDADVDRPVEAVLEPAVDVWLACGVDVVALAPVVAVVVGSGDDVAVVEVDVLVDVAAKPRVDY